MNTQQRRRIHNREHWESTLDAQNLRGEASADLQTQLALVETRDVALAFDHLSPLHQQMTLDLGGGLGLTALLMAQHGAFVVVVDVSLQRLLEAKRMIQEQGFADNVLFVHAEAESLPFRSGSMARIFTKSVLIHTDLARSTFELNRVLAANGRAALIEPTKGNPLVWLYRATLAPKEWKDITRYFDARSNRILRSAFRKRHRTTRADLYQFAFLATFFNYAIPMPRLYKIAEEVFLRVDVVMSFVLPPWKRLAWFWLYRVSPRDGRDDSR